MHRQNDQVAKSGNRIGRDCFLWYPIFMTGFIQTGPKLGNQFTADSLLRDYIRFRVPSEYLEEIERDLERFGERVVTDLWVLERRAETNLPQHIPYDPWGKRIDEIELDSSWHKLQRVAVEEGIISTGYERKQEEYSRLYQFAKLYMFHPSSAFATCPMAMTDGAARMIEVFGDDDLKGKAFKKLTSRSPQDAWTSGQWMTERSGGSDVSRTETIAVPDGDRYLLSGVKWFTSAITADMAMALARIEGAPSGSKGLSVFYIELRDENGNLQNVTINRLKDKLGTRALPTAELTLDRAPARLVGKQGDGVATIASLFNVTRMYNAMCALGTMRRGIALARAYATEREAFRMPIDQHPLHVETLAELQLDFAGAFHLSMHLSLLLGKEECGKASSDEIALVRLLTPIAKLFTGKKSVSVASEVVECFGGAGYIEDTGIPVLLRNSQVFPIWEGTTNILCLDVLRAIEKENAFDSFAKDVQGRLGSVQAGVLKTEVEYCEKLLSSVSKFLKKSLGEGMETLQAGARRFAFALGDLYAAALLLEYADWHLQNGEPHAERALAIAKRWVGKTCFDERIPQEQWREDSRTILF